MSTVSHLQGFAEFLQVMFGTQSCLKAVQDQSDGDVPAGMLESAQLLEGGLDLWRNVVIWAHQQHRSACIHTHKHMQTFRMHKNGSNISLA